MHQQTFETGPASPTPPLTSPQDEAGANWNSRPSILSRLGEHRIGAALTLVAATAAAAVFGVSKAKATGEGLGANAGIAASAEDRAWAPSAGASQDNSSANRSSGMQWQIVEVDCLNADNTMNNPSGIQDFIKNNLVKQIDGFTHKNLDGKQFKWVTKNGQLDIPRVTFPKNYDQPGYAPQTTTCDFLDTNTEDGGGANNFMEKIWQYMRIKWGLTDPNKLDLFVLNGSLHDCAYGGHVYNPNSPAGGPTTAVSRKIVVASTGANCNLDGNTPPSVSIKNGIIKIAEAGVVTAAMFYKEEAPDLSVPPYSQQPSTDILNGGGLGNTLSPLNYVPFNQLTLSARHKSDLLNNSQLLETPAAPPPPETFRITGKNTTAKFGDFVLGTKKLDTFNNAYPAAMKNKVIKIKLSPAPGMKVRSVTNSDNKQLGMAPAIKSGYIYERLDHDGLTQGAEKPLIISFTKK